MDGLHLTIGTLLQATVTHILLITSVEWCIILFLKNIDVMKNIIIYLVVTLAFTTCNKNENDMFNLDRAIEISIKDSHGNDLLNPNNENSFQNNDIKLFYVIDNKSVEVYNPNNDYPRNFFI
jgi:hypothetical protein